MSLFQEGNIYPENSIIGTCKACGGERIIVIDPDNLPEALHALSSMKTQICGSGNPDDRWTLLEGYMWDFRGVAEQLAHPTPKIKRLLCGLGIG